MSVLLCEAYKKYVSVFETKFFQEDLDSLTFCINSQTTLFLI